MLFLLFLPLVKHWLVAELGSSIQVSLHLCPGLVTYPPPQHSALVARGGREPQIVRWRHGAVKRIWEKLLLRARAAVHAEASPRRTSQGCLGGTGPCQSITFASVIGSPWSGNLLFHTYFQPSMSSWVLMVFPFQSPKCFPGRRADLRLYDQTKNKRTTVI